MPKAAQRLLLPDALHGRPLNGVTGHFDAMRRSFRWQGTSRLPAATLIRSRSELGSGLSGSDPSGMSDIQAACGSGRSKRKSACQKRGISASAMENIGMAVMLHSWIIRGSGFLQMAQLGMVSLNDVSAGRVDFSLPQTGNCLVEIEPGLFLGRTDMPLRKGMTYDSEAFPFAALSVLLEGKISPQTRGIEELHPNGMLAISNNERRNVASTFHGAERLRNVEVVVTPDWFERSSRFRDDPEFDRLREAMRKPLRSRHGILDPRIRQVAERVLAIRSGGALTALRMEAAALDLLAELAGSFHAKPKPERLSPADRERIYAIREFLETHPEDVGSLGRLATEYGVSASKLKRDFFLAFQTCIGGFANEQRLLTGKRLLEEGMSVSQVAYRIGYSHPANFSAAFKRRFAVSPRDVRR
ncbi:helix-turn-helix transcriptional regulator [Pseudochelatococcus sp. B33]